MIVLRTSVLYFHRFLQHFNNFNLQVPYREERDHVVDWVRGVPNGHLRQRREHHRVLLRDLIGRGSCVKFKNHFIQPY